MQPTGTHDINGDPIMSDDTVMVSDIYGMDHESDLTYAHGLWWVEVLLDFVPLDMAVQEFGWEVEIVG